MPQPAPSPSILPWPNPRWKENPYQKILYEGLSRSGVKIRATPPAFALLPHVPRFDWLHLNWPETRYANPNPAKRASELLRFVRILERLKGRGTRILWTMHNEFPHEAADHSFHRKANRQLLELADLTHVHFPQAATLLEDAYGVTPGAVHVMQHPHYGDHYGERIPRSDARARLGLDPASRVVLVFGYLRRYKGIETAVQSMAKTGDPSLRLVVAGKAEDEATAGILEEAAGTDVRIIVRLGHVPPSDVMPLFAAADAFLFPSQDYFTSGSLMLALTYGVPVIAAPINHAGTFVGRSFLCPWEPATEAHLTELLQALPDWLANVRQEDFAAIRREWAAESLSVGLVERLWR